MSREMYDLCRMYKHFYKKHKDVKSWSNKYHDLHLDKAVDMTKRQLCDVEYHIAKQILKDLDVNILNVECEREYLGTQTVVDIKNSETFVNVLIEYVADGRKLWR